MDVSASIAHAKHEGVKTLGLHEWHVTQRYTRYLRRYEAWHGANGGFRGKVPMDVPAKNHGGRGG